MLHFSARRMFLLLGLGAWLAPWAARAEDKPAKEGTPIEILDGAFRLVPPAAWEKKEPASNIIEYEFEAPAAEGDKRPGRITMMSAGGTVEANLDRWYAQFKQPDGGDTRDKAGEPEKIEAAGQEIQFVDLQGTYIDKPPRAEKGVDRPKYRMLGAIVATKKSGNFYIKFYGPEKTVGEYVETFKKMLAGMQAVE